MQRKYRMLLTFLVVVILLGCNEEQTDQSVFLSFKETSIKIKEVPETDQNINTIDLDLFRKQPTEWGENVTGVKTRIKTDEKQMALTFDACGGDYGNGCDRELIDFLKREKIPATLFVNERWLIANERLFLELADDPLFQIENHGSHHSPLSVNGGEAWNIPATETPQDAHDEIMSNHEAVQKLTGKDMTLFRSGTAYYDEVAVELANTLGYEIVNFDILGDAGATYTSEQVKNALMSAKPGSIALLHMNQPQSGTADGVIQAIPLLQDKGFEFVLLENKTLE